MQSAANQQKQTILIVEDDPDARELLERMVESLGFRTIAAPDGPRAFELLKSETPHAALLDVMLPMMNGHEIVQKLRRTQDLSQIPIILVTARDDESQVIEGYQHGADYYLVKPFTTRQLEAALELYLGTHRR